MAKKINYSDPLPREALDEILNRAFTAADNLEQHTMNSKQQRQTALQQEIKQRLTGTSTKNIINETNKTDMKQMNNIQTNTNTTDENIPTWKKLYRSFGYMMITFMFVYAGSNIIIWLYDTLGMEHIMPTLIGIIIWILVYDHMYGTASKAPRIK